MAYRFEFDPATRILQCRFEGRVTDDGLTDFYRQAAEFVEALNPRGGLVDFSAVTFFDVTVETIRRLAKSAPAMPESSHPRIIVAMSSHVFGMARMFEFEGEGTRPNLHVVRSLDEALAILGANKPEFEPVSDLFDSSSEESGA